MKHLSGAGRAHREVRQRRVRERPTSLIGMQKVRTEKGALIYITPEARLPPFPYLGPWAACGEVISWTAHQGVPSSGTDQ